MTREKERKKIYKRHEKNIETAKRKQAKLECQLCHEVKKLVNQHNRTKSAHAIIRAIKYLLSINLVW